MRIGDMLDAYSGYTEAENERIKSLAYLIRTATLKLWNTQIIEKERIIDEAEFWPFPWEKRRQVSERKEPGELEKNADAQAEFLLKNFPDGKRNYKS